MAECPHDWHLWHCMISFLLISFFHFTTTCCTGGALDCTSFTVVLLCVITTASRFRVFFMLYLYCFPGNILADRVFFNLFYFRWFSSPYITNLSALLSWRKYATAWSNSFGASRLWSFDMHFTSSLHFWVEIIFMVVLKWDRCNCFSTSYQNFYSVEIHCANKYC